MQPNLWLAGRTQVAAGLAEAAERWAWLTPRDARGFLDSAAGQDAFRRVGAHTGSAA